MKLQYFRGDVPNFGDELNIYMWPRLLPEGVLDEDGSELFLGIGSILLDQYPPAPRKIVMGSGYAGYTCPPPIHDGSWEVSFVRGPRTAAALGLPSETAVSDSAVLIRALDLPPPAGPGGVAFMPHFESLERGNWREACRLSGLHLIDPTDEVPAILSQLRGTRMLITEAMHGAIVADALRIPWLPVLPLNPVHHQKWHDWADSLSIGLHHHPLRPTSVMEIYTSRSGGRGGTGGRAGKISRNPILSPVNHALTHRAAAHLQRLAQAEPQLSADARIAEVTERALAKLDGFLRARSFGPAIPRIARPLS